MHRRRSKFWGLGVKAGARVGRFGVSGLRFKDTFRFVRKQLMKPGASSSSGKSQWLGMWRISGG